MGRLKTIARYLAVPIGIFAIQACSGLGYQGGSIPTTFSGLSTATAISPKSIKLTWSSYTGSTKYNIYTPDSNSPAFVQNFTSYYQFSPVPADQSIQYKYSVTAVDPVTGQEQGDRSNYLNVQLLPDFSFRDTGSVTAISNTSIRVNWPSSSTVTYLVYVAERLPTGIVNYNNFVASQATVTDNSGSALIQNGLQEGHEYCTVVVAQYADQYNDSPDGTLFTGDVGANLSNIDPTKGPVYLKDASGTFGNSRIAQSQKCVRTKSAFSVTSVNIYAQKASLSNQPVFYVYDSRDATEDTTGFISTSIYQVNAATGLSTLIGSRIGTGRIAAQVAIPSGAYQFFALVSDTMGTTAQAKVEIQVGPSAPVPLTQQDRQTMYVRSFNTSENPASPTGYYPQKQQDGYGTQREGSSVAVGDFNCDGKLDIAIGIPSATTMAPDNRPAKSGKVLIYYDMTNSNPGTTQRVQTITFDMTAIGGDPSRDLQLGTSLHVGNFNGDNQATNQPPSVGSSSLHQYSCDDLAIGSGYGPMFVLYGKRDLSIANGDLQNLYGGLNYLNATSYVLNPSSICQPSNNICGVAMYAQGTSPGTFAQQLGVKMTSGDYNGDGYEDLAVTSQGNSAANPHGIWVFRGSDYGLIEPNVAGNAYNDGVDSIATKTSLHTGFPFLPVTVTPPNPITSLYPLTTPTPYAGWGVGSTTGAGGGFGTSIGTLHNAYYDYDQSTGHGTGRIRDVLLIGNPNYVTAGASLVHACIPGSDYTQTAFGTIGSNVDVNTNFLWNCSGVITQPVPASLPGGYTNFIPLGFGSAMADIKTALRYQPNQFTDTTNCTSANSTFGQLQEGYGNCSATSPLGYPGAIAISATTASTGAVFIYYALSHPDVTATTRNQIGLSINHYLFQLLLGKTYTNTSLTYLTDSPCTVDVAGNEICSVQFIHHPSTGPTVTSGSYGLVLGGFPGNTTDDATSQAKDSILAVAAPYKNYTLSSGTTYNATGSVQLYLQNSRSLTNPIVVKAQSGFNPTLAPTFGGTNNTNDPCTNAGVCRYADGFSNSLTTSLDFDGTLADNINFGLGGVVGGPLFSGAGGYNSNSDIVIGAPGEVGLSPAGDSIVDNGAALAFFSNGGTYRNYEVTDATTNASPWHIMDRSFSQEADMKFHQAIALGDINQDGIDDVAVRVNQGTRNFVRIYNGASSKVGFNTTAGNYTDLKIQGDATAGIRFVPLGGISPTTLPAYWVTSSTQSYVIFDGIGGLVGGFPTAFGTGGVPRKMYAPNYSVYDPASALYLNYLTFRDTDFYNTETPGQIDSTLRSYTNFVYGDFNGDGYMDVAIGYNGYQSITDVTKGKNCNGSGYTNLCAHGGIGRVMVFYGGADNGFQTQPDSAGGYPLGPQKFTDYTADGASGDANMSNAHDISYPTTYSSNLAHSYFGAPCLTNGTNCRIQMLHEGSTSFYGSSLASIPAGTCTNTTTQKQYKVNALAVNAYKGGTNTPLIYVYRPKCMDGSSPANANDFSGLVSYSEDGTSSATLSIPAGSSSSVGISMIGATNLMGTATISGTINPNATIASHLVVTDQAMSRVMVYPVMSTSTIDPYTTTAEGGRLIDYSTSAMLSGTNGTNVGFGNGLAAVGDVNGDGFNDIGIAVSSLNRVDTTSQSVSEGAVLVLFGSSGGLQSHTNSAFTAAIEPSRTASCYVAPVTTTVNSITTTAVTSICNPALLYPPEPTNSLRDGSYERSFLSPNAYLKTSSAANGGLGTFLFGVPGRDSLEDAVPPAFYGSTRILQGGAFYVLP